MIPRTFKRYKAAMRTFVYNNNCSTNDEHSWRFLARSSNEVIEEYPRMSQPERNCERQSMYYAQPSTLARRN